MRNSPGEVVKRAAKADLRKQEWRTLYEECYEFALPNRNLYGDYEGGTIGRSKMERVFDSTAIASTQRFANRLQSTLFPPYRNWCRLVPGVDLDEEFSEDPGKRDELNLALDIYNEKLFQVIRQTNFDLSMGEFLLDLAVGTAVMLIRPGDIDAPVRFETVPPFLVSFEEGRNNTIQNVFRRMKVKAEVIKQNWPDAKFSDELKKKIDENRLFKKL